MTHAPLLRQPKDEKVPRIMITAILILLGTVVSLVAVARLTGMEPIAKPVSGPILSERILHIESNIAGAARVTDVDGNVVTDLGRGKAVFISTVNRVIQRERLRHRADPNGPLHLRMHEGGRLAIFDPGTGQETNLMPFGRDNVAAFARLLDPQHSQTAQNGSVTK